MWSHMLVHYSSWWLSNIPVYGSDTLYTWWQAFCCFHLWALMKSTARAFLNKLFYFFEHNLLVLFGVHLALKFLEHMVNPHPIIWETVKWFPTVVQSFIFPPTSYKGSNILTASPRLVIVLFGKIWPPSVYVKKDLMHFFICMSLITNDTKCFCFHMSLGYLYLFLGKVSFQEVSLFLVGLSIFSLDCWHGLLNFFIYP